MTEFRYSWSRSMASPPGTSTEHRTTKAPSGVVALKLRLVRPPASSVISRGRSRSTPILSQSDGGSTALSFPTDDRATALPGSGPVVPVRAAG